MDKEKLKHIIKDYFYSFSILPNTKIMNTSHLGKEAQIIQTENPFFFFNAGFDLCPSISQEEAQGLVDLFKLNEKSFSLWVDNDEVSTTYFENLSKSGFLHLLDAALTSGQLIDIDFDHKGSPSMTLVTNNEEFSKWLTPFLEVYEFPVEETRDFMLSWGSENLNKRNNDFLNFYLEDEEEVLAIGSLHIAGKSCGLFNLGVPEKHRRKGYADSLTKQMAKYAYDRGVTHIGGAGSAMGMELYKNFDIKVHGSYSLWAYFHS
ncbi:MAG: ribosomal protein S18 acetylase RimI-like enzyme [Bacteriovoracaceae bacterium]|jgi:ribosomal protein S18 acetylase RimI-like enzyme